MRPHHKLANLLGYDLLKHKTKQATLESHLMVLFERLNIQVVIDVGANKGQYAQFLRKIGFNGSIISFEPVSSTYKILEQNSIHDDSWMVFNVGLGSKNETLKINVSTVSELASIHEPSQYGLKLFGDSMLSEKSETINVIQLDSFMDEHKQRLDITGNCFLKMDTQGYDLEVFKGALGSLDSIVGLQSEIPLKSIYSSVQNYHDILKFYEANRFEISGVYPVSRDSDTFGLIEVDCVMVNKLKLS